jgi:hypothetical protein
VSAAGTVALLAAYIPLGDLFCLDVVVNGVTAVAGRSGGTVEVCGSVVRHPPIGARLYVIREPPVLLDIPLRWKREVIVSALGEIALLESPPIGERDVV